MANNFQQPGETLELTMPSNVTSGQGVLVGSIFGVALSSALAGARVNVRVVGVWTIPALATDTGAEGTKMYWDNTNKRLTVTSAGNTLVGALTKVKANGETTATIRLSGQLS